MPDALLSSFFSIFKPPPPGDEDADPTIIVFYPYDVDRNQQYFAVGCVLSASSVMSSLNEDSQPIIIETSAARVATHESPQDGVLFSLGMPALIPFDIIQFYLRIFVILAQGLGCPSGNRDVSTMISSYRSIMPLLGLFYRTIRHAPMAPLFRLPTFTVNSPLRRAQTLSSTAVWYQLLMLPGLLGATLLVDGEVIQTSMQDTVLAVSVILATGLKGAHLLPFYLSPALLMALTHSQTALSPDQSPIERSPSPCPFLPASLPPPPPIMQPNIEDYEGAPLGYRDPALHHPSLFHPSSESTTVAPHLELVDLPEPFGDQFGPGPMQRGCVVSLLLLTDGPTTFVAFLDSSWRPNRHNRNRLNSLRDWLHVITTTYRGIRMSRAGAQQLGAGLLPQNQSQALGSSFHNTWIRCQSGEVSRMTAVDEAGLHTRIRMAGTQRRLRPQTAPAPMTGGCQLSANSRGGIVTRGMPSMTPGFIDDCVVLRDLQSRGHGSARVEHLDGSSLTITVVNNNPVSRAEASFTGTAEDTWKAPGRRK